MTWNKPWPKSSRTPAIKRVAEISDEKLRRAAQPIGKPYWRIADVSDSDGVILEILERSRFFVARSEERAI